MSSQQQIAANRRNGKMSTGPRSSAGKARSSQNALKHGLTAEYVLLPNEDPAEREELRQAVFTSLAPEGALEIQLVEHVVSLVWRLRRVAGFEVALFTWVRHVQAEEDGSVDAMLDLDSRTRLPPASTDTEDDDGTTREVLEIGRTFEAMLKTGLTDKLSRYETTLQRQLSSTLKELRELKANRPIPVKCIDAAA